jgi:protein-disulfide isomerase
MDIPTPSPQHETPQFPTRRERREQRRAQMRAEQKGFMRRRFVWRILTWTVAIAMIIGLGWGMVKLANQVPAASDGGKLAVPVGVNENIRGPDDAPLTIVEYSDMQCPACAAYQPLMEQAFAEPELAGKVRLVFRHFPLTKIHPNAQQSAQAAQAAALQGKFWEMHDLLFKEQSSWAKLTGAAAGEKFRGYASSLGLDVSRWEEDRDSGAVKDKVAADVTGADASGVNSTPTFFINGTQMTPPQSYDDFKQQLLDALDALP